MTRRRVAVPLLALLAACAGDERVNPVPRDEPEAPPPPRPYALALSAPAGPAAGPITVTAIPDPPQVTLKVELRVDGELLALDLTPPFSVELDPAGLADGAHEITAVATHIDGRTAEAAAAVQLDNTAPLVGALSPASGARLLPLGPAAFALASSEAPPTVTSGAAGFAGEALTPISLPGLTAALPLPPVDAFPSPRTIAWEVRDAAGNARAGEVPVVLTHARFDLSMPEHAGLAALPDHRTLIGTGPALRAVDERGQLAWQLAPPASTSFAGMIPAGGGAVTAVLRLSPLTAEVLGLARVLPDGSIAWMQPQNLSSEGYLDIAYDEGSDAFVTSKYSLSAGPVQTGTLVEVDASGAVNALAALPPDRIALELSLSREAAPVITAHTIDTTGAGPGRIEVFARDGAPLWSADIPPSDKPLAGVLALSAEVALVVEWAFEIDCIGLRGVGPAGPLWSFGLEQGCFDRIYRLPGGDLLVSFIFDSNLVRLRPDGTVAWDIDHGEYTSLQIGEAGILVALTEPEEVRLLDLDGATLSSWYPPQDLEATSTTTLRLTRPLSSGFYAARARSTAGGNTARTTVWRVDGGGVARWREDIDGGQLVEAMLVSPADEELLTVLRQPALPGQLPPSRVYRLVP